jgi:hypothetical protein
MNTKLTLNIKGSVIEEAKKYAKSNNTSLSKLIEAYLGTLTTKNKKQKKTEITPLVESLIGVIELPEGFDEKTNYSNYLIEKYK